MLGASPPAHDGVTRVLSVSRGWRMTARQGCFNAHTRHGWATTVRQGRLDVAHVTVGAWQRANSASMHARHAAGARRRVKGRPMPGAHGSAPRWPDAACVAG